MPALPRPCLDTASFAHRYASTHPKHEPVSRTGGRGRRRSRGLSLMELVVTLALMGVLASLAAPLAEMAVQRSKERQLRAGLQSLRHAIDAYKHAADAGLITGKVGSSGYPPTLDALTGITPIKGDAKAGDSSTVFLRTVPRDPFASPDLPPAATWGLRAYASPPDQPAPGDDVFDVYSRADGKGMNGQPYREW
jgi:general secretion pathway protein G